MTATVAMPTVAGPPRIPLDGADVTTGTGLRLLAARRGGAPLAEVRLVIPLESAGVRQAATAELLATTMLGGVRPALRGAGSATTSRSDLDRALAGLGATLTATVLPESLNISGYALADRLAPLLELLGAVLTDAYYPDEDVAVQRSQLGHRLRTHISQPQIIARQALLRRCFGDHPAACEVPAEHDLGGLSSTDMRRLHAARVVSAGATLVIVGAAGPESTLHIAEEALSGWGAPAAVSSPAGAVEPTDAIDVGWGGPPPAVRPDGIQVIDHPSAQRIMVGLAAAAPGEDDAGYPAAYLANLVFGGYFASRLFEHLRETLGCVYRCNSTLIQRRGIGVAMVEFASDVSRAAQALEETHAELRRIAGQEPPTAAEVGAARGFATGSRAVAMAGQAGLADALAALALRNRPLERLMTWPDEVAQTSDEQVRAAAAGMFDPDVMTGFVRGPATVLTGAPSPLGGLLPPVRPINPP